MSSFRLRLSSYCLLAVSPVLTAAPVVDKHIAIGVYSQQTDNANYSDTNTQSDIVNRYYVDARADGQRRYFDYGIRYLVQKESYLDNTYGDNDYVRGNAFINAKILPGRFMWFNRITSNVTQRDRTGEDVPSNRDQRNIIETRPQITLAPTGRDRVLLSASYRRVDFRETANSNSDRVAATVTWNHGLSPLSQIGATCEATNVVFEEQADYDSYLCKGTLNYRLKDGTVEFSVGQKQNEPENGDAVTGATFALEANYSADRHDFYLVAMRDVTDSSVGFERISLIDNQLRNFDIDTDDAALVTRTRFVAGYQQRITATWSASGFVFRDFENVAESDNDTLRQGALVSVSKVLNWNMNAFFNFRQEDITYETSGADLEESNTLYRLGLGKAFNENFSVTGGISQEIQDSDRGGFEGGDYEINSIFADLRYEF